MGAGMMGHRRSLAGGVLAASLWVLPATAQEQGSRTGELSFLAADTNGDGLIDEAELTADQAKRFRQLDADRNGLLSPGELSEHDPAAFTALDTNGDGQLSFSEVMAGKLSDFARADGSGDGRLSYDEVVKFEAGSR